VAHDGSSDFFFPTFFQYHVVLILRRSMRRVFVQAGWEVCGEAENGQEPIEKAKSLNPQVIVLDLACASYERFDRRPNP
jgi:chemotaxis response regulator CheB